MYDPNEECKAMIAALKELCQRKNMTENSVIKKSECKTCFQLYYAIADSEDENTYRQHRVDRDKDYCAVLHNKKCNNKN